MPFFEIIDSGLENWELVEADLWEMADVERGREGGVGHDRRAPSMDVLGLVTDMGVVVLFPTVVGFAFESASSTRALFMGVAGLVG